MNFADILIWLVVLVELVLCIAVMIILLKVMRGVTITVNVHQNGTDPAPATTPTLPPDIDDLQKKLDELEQDRRKGEQQLIDLVGSINQFMTGGNEDAKQ